MDKKFFLKSWTVILNGLTALAGGLLVLREMPEFVNFLNVLPPDQQALVGKVLAGVALVNLLLRLKTKEPVTMRKDK